MGTGSRRENAERVYATRMEKKPPADDPQNRFAEVIRKSQQRRIELNNKARRKQMEDIDLPPRDEEMIDSKDEDEPEA
jgi:hypothetical protein